MALTSTRLLEYKYTAREYDRLLCCMEDVPATVRFDAVTFDVQPYVGKKYIRRTEFRRGIMVSCAESWDGNMPQPWVKELRAHECLVA